MKKNAQLNKYGAILLLSDLWCAYDWGDANVSYDQVLKNEWALSPQTNINNIVVDVKTKDGTFSRRTLQFNDADWKMYLEVKDTNGDRAVFTPNNSNGTIRIKKKLFLAVALVMGLGTSVAFANNMVSDVEIVTMINEFKPIDVKELPQAVQDAIKENYSEATIKEAAVEVAEDGTKTYKVTLVDVAGTENPVLFNEKGEVQK